jgi:hypothetical protein
MIKKETGDAQIGEDQNIAEQINVDELSERDVKIEEMIE